MAKIRCALLSSVLLFLPFFEVLSTYLPKTTPEILKRLNVKASILGGIDQELQVPKDWLEKGKNSTSWVPLLRHVRFGFFSGRSENDTRSWK